jgi:hypothetical protein
VPLAATLVIGMATVVTSAATASTPAIERLGVLEVPGWDTTHDVIDWRFIGVDTERDTLYSLARPSGSIGHMLVAHDTTSRIPNFKAMSESWVVSSRDISPYTSFLDPAGRRLYSLQFNTNEGRPQLVEIDLDAMATVGVTELAAVIPGFLPIGMTGSPGGTLYFVGEFGVVNASDDLPKLLGIRPLGPGPAIVAMDATSGAVSWVYPLRDCPEILDAWGIGAFIGLSASRNALYTFCDGGGVAGVTAGQSGLHRLSFPDDAGAADSVSVQDDYFPVSGHFRGASSTGIAGFDPQSERVFVQSLSYASPGAWVFDGSRDAWVGFVAAPNRHVNFLGVRPTDGRYYMVSTPQGDGNPGFINVTDGRSTPVAQGALSPAYINSFVVPDPDSRRIFAAENLFFQDPEEHEFVSFAPSVWIDNSEPISPLPGVAWDSLTTTPSAGQSTLETYSAGTAGFGARYELVGGYEGSLSLVKGATALFAVDPPNPLGLSFGDRGSLMSVVMGTDTRSAGVSAAASFAAPDQATLTDASDTLRTVGADGQETAAYQVTSCLDGTGEARDESTEGPGGIGSARVVCDLKGAAASAEASFAAGVQAGGVTTGGSSIMTRSYRDPELGAVTETRATAEAIRMEVPGAGALVMDKVTAIAASQAAGVPGTTAARWERHIDGFSIVGADGTATTPRSCHTRYEAGGEPTKTGDCDALLSQLNELWQGRVHVRLPLPVTAATPGGAYSAVEKPEDLYLTGLTVNNDDSEALPAIQIVVTNDSVEKSRVLVQLAAVRVNSIYTISAFDPTPSANPTTPAPTEASPTVTPPPDQTSNGESIAVPIGGSRPDAAPPTAAPPPPITAAPVATAEGWVPTVRSPSEAALVGALLALFGWPIADLVRRRRLLEVLR